MTVLGKAAVAMWWDMATEYRQEFEDWHTHEHFPERMSIPGFLRGSRWSALDGGDGFFVMYELEDYAVLSSAAYLERLNYPTPWSTKLMPHHSGMVRSQCRVLESAGGGVGRCVLTIRLSPASGQDEALRAWLARFAAGFAMARGGVGCHLLRTETPQMPMTVEQQIRGGGDRAADWVLVVMGYDLAVLQDTRRTALSDAALQAQGASPGSVAGWYQLAHAASAADVRP